MGKETLNVKHESIVGKSARDVILNSRGKVAVVPYISVRTILKLADSGIPYRITLPSLEEYVALTPREVTPVQSSPHSTHVNANWER